MAKTLHGKLLEEGFEVIKIIKESKLPKGLAKLSEKYPEGLPPSIRVISGEEAFAGSAIYEKCGLREPIQIVYEKKKQAEEEITAGPYFEFKDSATPDLSLYATPFDRDIQ